MDFVISAFCVIAFLVGGIPFGYLLGRVLLKDDIRKHGSGNIDFKETSQRREILEQLPQNQDPNLGTNAKMNGVTCLDST